MADSGPLHYLILLGHVDLLQRFYGDVLVPEPVAGELTTASAPDTVREWMTDPPTWVDVRPVAADAISRVTDDSGTLGVLRAGAERGVVNVPDLIERLTNTTFYMDEALLKSVFAPWLEPSQPILAAQRL